MRKVNQTFNQSRLDCILYLIIKLPSVTPKQEGVKFTAAPSHMDPLSYKYSTYCAEPFACFKVTELKLHQMIKTFLMKGEHLNG